MKIRITPYLRADGQRYQLGELFDDGGRDDSYAKSAERPRYLPCGDRGPGKAGADEQPDQFRDGVARRPSLWSPSGLTLRATLLGPSPVTAQGGIQFKSLDREAPEKPPKSSLHPHHARTITE